MSLPKHAFDTMEEGTYLLKHVLDTAEEGIHLLSRSDGKLSNPSGLKAKNIMTRGMQTML